MKKKWSYVIIIVMAVTMISSTSNVKANHEELYGSSIEQATYKAALMIGGDETDMGFSYVAIQGMNQLRDKYGWEISISRQVQYPDIARILNEYGSSGYDVVFVVGGMFIDFTYGDIVSNYNDTLFVQIPGLEDPNGYFTPKNLVGLHPAFQTVGHYLAGVLAGKMTTTNRLGVVFGEWYGYLSMEFFAFKAGVESVNDDAIVYCRVAGTWGDAAIGKQITDALISAKNIDIVVQVADTTGRGVIASAQANDIVVIGTVGDQAILAPDVTMTSVGMDTPLLMDIVAKRIENDTAESVLGGKSWDIPIGNYLYPYHQFNDTIPQAVKDLVIDVKIAIENGTITVPRIEEDFPPEDPDANDTTTTIPATTTTTTIPDTTTTTGAVTPGFQLLELLTVATMIGIPIVMRRRRKR